MVDNKIASTLDYVVDFLNLKISNEEKERFQNELNTVADNCNVDFKISKDEKIFGII